MKITKEKVKGVTVYKVDFGRFISDINLDNSHSYLTDLRLRELAEECWEITAYITNILDN